MLMEMQNHLCILYMLIFLNCFLYSLLSSVLEIFFFLDAFVRKDEISSLSLITLKESCCRCQVSQSRCSSNLQYEFQVRWEGWEKERGLVFPRIGC